MVRKEGNFLTRFLDKIDKIVPDSLEEVEANQIIKGSGQLERRKQSGNDNFSVRNIPGLFNKLSEKRFITYSGNPSLIELSEDKDSLSTRVTLDSNYDVRIAIRGMKRGELRLVIGGEKIPVYDPHYLREMIPREIISLRDLLSRGTISEWDLINYYKQEPSTVDTIEHYNRLSDPRLGLLSEMRVVRDELTEQGKACEIYPICCFNKLALVASKGFVVRKKDGMFCGKPFINTLRVHEVLATIELDKENTVIINGDTRIVLDPINNGLSELILDKIENKIRPINIMDSNFESRGVNKGHDELFGNST